MTRLINTLFGTKHPKSNDFSEFFGKSSRDRVKVMKRVLKEANAEQRRVIEKR